MVYLNFLVQSVLCIAALLLDLVHLEVCASLHVPVLHGCFGFHLLKLMFEVENHFISVLGEETISKRSMRTVQLISATEVRLC